MQLNKIAFKFTIVALAVSILFIFVAYNYYSNEKKRVEESKHGELSAIGKLKTDQYIQWHQERLSEAHFFSKTPSFVAAASAICEGDSGSSESLRQSLLHIMTNNRYENIFILDTAFQPIFSAVPAKLTLDSTSVEHCKQVFTTGQLSTRDYFYCPIHKSIHYEIFAPIKDNGNKTFAVMMFSINPNDYIYALLSNWPNKSKTSETILVRQEGDSIRYLSPLKRTDNSKLSLVFSNEVIELPSVQAFNQVSGLFQGRDYAGKKVLVDLSLIPQTNYALINKIDVGELYADFNKQTIMIMLITALSVLLVALIVAWFYNLRQRSLYRKLLENKNKLEEREEQYRLIMDNSLDAILLTATNGSILSANKAAEQMFGMSEKEICERGRNGLVDLNDPNLKTLIREREITGKTKGELTFLHRDGTKFPTEITSSVFKSASGELLNGLIVRNIKERKHHENVQKILYEIARESMFINTIEELLMSVKEQLGTELDASNFYVARYLSDKKMLKQLVFINETFNSEEWPIENTLSGTVISKGESLLIKGDQINAFYKTRLSDPDFKTAKCWLGVPLKQENETVGIMVVQSYYNENAYNQQHKILLEMIAHELEIVMQRNKMINDLIEAKNKAEESDRLKSAFLANVSHEIRTPMNGILGFLELLTLPDLSSDQKEMYLNIMNKSGQRLLDTINDIIELSKIEAGQLIVNFTEVNVEELMDFQYNFFLPKAREKGLVFEIEQTAVDAVTYVTTDKHKINGIFTNLINNALKYTEVGMIKFGCYVENESLVFYVKDTGIGIPKEKQQLIFERFNQVDGMLTRQKEGAGLGLSIVQAYIHIIGGTIWLESELGKGSCFFFSIPLIKN
jgi:PAS domain S-box-containing protein